MYGNTPVNLQFLADLLCKPYFIEGLGTNCRKTNKITHKHKYGEQDCANGRGDSSEVRTLNRMKRRQ